MNTLRSFRTSDLQFSPEFESNLDRADILILPGLSGRAQREVSDMNLRLLRDLKRSQSEDLVMLLLGGVAVAATVLAFGA